MLSGGSLGNPGILPWCPLRHRSPCCPDDSLDIPGSSFHVPSDTGPHAVRMIPWTSRDPPLVSTSDTGPHAVQRISWTSRDPPLVSSSDTDPQADRRIPGFLISCPARVCLPARNVLVNEVEFLGLLTQK